MDEDTVTDSYRLEAIYEQIRDVKRLLAVLVVMALGWTIWFTMNRATESAEADARERVACISRDDC